MVKSSWLQQITPLALALAIGSLSVIAVYDRLYHPDNQSSQEQTADLYTQRAEERISIECIRLDSAASTRCRNEIIQSADENRRAEQDLEQQTNMAVWTFWMMIASFGSVGITAVGVIYVARTLDQTVAANKAANSAVAVTRKIGEAQVRAYLSIQKVTAVATLKDDGASIHYKVFVRNSGQSPAIGVAVFAIEPTGPDEAVSDVKIYIGNIAAGSTEVASIHAFVEGCYFTVSDNGARFVPAHIKAKAQAKDVFGADVVAVRRFSGRLNVDSPKRVRLIKGRSIVARVTIAQHTTKAAK